MTAPFNPYNVLKLFPEVSTKAIKSAYRKLCAVYHPDNKETGDEAEFHRIQRAYEILSDPVRRKRYDETGSVSVSSSKRVMGFVKNIISCVVSEEDDPKRDNVLEKVIEALGDTDQTQDEAIKEKIKKMIRVAELMDRFSCDGEVPDVVKETLKDQLQSLNDQIASHRETIAFNAEVIEFLGHFSYRVDGPAFRRYKRSGDNLLIEVQTEK